ncbi:hypothetical protein VTJ49DRAFT_6569 [Mycothermus thermophilus]|uniref:Indole-diterpene biosynthesis protein PaxU n=1 Tax=Humicola insolens TaxID=85995 RepID=A0ABR3VLN0_HUMIN
MASNTALTQDASPLGFMTKLSPAVYLFRPSPAPASAASSTPGPVKADTHRRRTPAPKLILVASWMGARDPHIAKYLAQHRALFPSSPILLVRSEQRHWFRQQSRLDELVPAAEVFRSFFPDATLGAGEPGEPELLIHAFSNGGATSLITLRRLLAAGATKTAEERLLPPYALVLDSAPGTFRYWPSYQAFTVGVARGPLWRWLLVAPFVHMLCAWYWARFVGPVRLMLALRRLLPGRTSKGEQRWDQQQSGPVREMRKGLNDATMRAAEVRRTYLYGVDDALVDWRDVEAHAEEAERVGFVRVRREKVVGGEHVALVRVDAERYWRVVRETWEGEDGRASE